MRLVRLPAGLLAGSLLLAGCGGPEPPDGADLVVDLAPEDAPAVGERVNAFGFDLLGEVADGESNTITAPVSAAALLAMVLAGAEGETAEEMGQVLHLEDARDVRMGALLEQLTDTSEVELSTANALWANNDVPLEEDYTGFVSDVFDATVEEADLGSQETAEEIDSWVADHTEDRIEEIAADLGLPNASALLVLVNTVYFLGEWTEPFDPETTTDAPFTLPDGTEAQVPQMRQSGEEFGYVERDGYRMLRLPYGEEERYGMEVLLPDEPDGLADLLASLDVDEWREAVDGLSAQRMNTVALPRFELEWEDDLSQPLQELGMERVFTPEADLGAMTSADAWLDLVAHKTYIRVDEAGTEAAGATGGSVVTSAPADPTEFVVDRPFAFTISDTETGTVLFSGTVADPRGE